MLLDMNSTFKVRAASRSKGLGYIIDQMRYVAEKANH